LVFYFFYADFTFQNYNITTYESPHRYEIGLEPECILTFSNLKSLHLLDHSVTSLGGTSSP